MQITQGVGLDTLQLLSGKEALQAFKVGQILRVKVVEGTPPERSGGRALLEIAGRQHEVRSLIPLKAGQRIQARLQLVGDRLLLQPVNHATGDDSQKSTDTTDMDPPQQRLLHTALRNLLPRQQAPHATIALTQAILEHPNAKRLPETLLNDLKQLLKTQPASPKPDGEMLRRIVERSGVFLEAALRGPTSEKAIHDFKGLLFRLLQQLSQLGISMDYRMDAWRLLQANLAQPPVQAGVSISPAMQFHPLRATKETADLPLETLLRQWFTLASGSLAHTTVKQIQHLQTNHAQLQLDLPWITPWGVIPLHVQIENDREAKQHQTNAIGRVWRFKLSITLPRLGEIQANLELADERVSLQLWAGHSTTRELLETNEKRLRIRLEQVGLRLSGIFFSARPVVCAQSPGHTVPRLLSMKA